MSIKNTWWWNEINDGPPRTMPEKSFFRGGWEARQPIRVILPPGYSSKVFLVAHEHADSGSLTLEIVGLDEDDGA